MRTLASFVRRRPIAAAGIRGLAGGRGPRGLALKRPAYSAVRSRYVSPSSADGSISLPSCHSLKLVMSTQCGSAAIASSHCARYSLPSWRATARPGLRTFVSS